MPSDEPEFPLAGVDAERPLPPELRARLESALLEALAGGLPVPIDADSLDAPRPLPEPVRARLESALLAAAAGSAAASAPPAPAAATPPTGSAPPAELVGAAASSPTAGSAPPAGAAGVASSPTAGSAPPAGAAGVVTSLDGRRRRKVMAAWSAVAAVLLLVVAVAGLLGRGGSGSQSLEAAGGPTTTTAGTPAPVPSGADVTEPTSPATTGPAATASTRPARPARPVPSTAGPQAGATATTRPATPAPAGPGPPQADPGGGQPAASTDPGPAPPFYNSTSGDAGSPAPAMSSPSGGAASDGSQGAPPPAQRSIAPTAGALRVGIVTGDAAQEAGFRAYVNRLNQSGGVRGHSIELVPVSPGSPAAGTIATVNLGAQPVAGAGGAPGWAGGPLLETLTATENLLSGNGAVFSFASPPERQGHLVADALFPSASPGTKVVIYAATGGPLHDAVPAAIRAVLEPRNIKVTVVSYVSGQAMVDADAAFLSLDPAAAKAWVAQAKSDGYRPAKGVGGIYSLADEALLPDLPEGARVVSPYVVPGGDEGQAIRSDTGGTSASVLHGWANAKALAAAIWRSGADTPAEMQAGLQGLAGWSSGLAPPYETRPNTRSRTPEGVLFQVQSGAFVTQGGFRRDSF